MTKNMEDGEPDQMTTSRVCSSHEKPAALPRFLYLYDLIGVQRLIPGERGPRGGPVAVGARRKPIGSKWRVLAHRPRGKDRVVALESDGDSVFDEIVVNDLNLHIEQMSARNWWAQIGDAYCSFYVRRDGTVEFNIRRGEYGPILGRTEAPLTAAERAEIRGLIRRGEF